VKLDYPTLELLRQNHPAWRLLRSDHAPHDLQHLSDKRHAMFDDLRHNRLDCKPVRLNPV
jgi:hypothetical protein